MALDTGVKANGKVTTRAKTSKLTSNSLPPMFTKAPSASTAGPTPYSYRTPAPAPAPAPAPVAPASFGGGGGGGGGGGAAPAAPPMMNLDDFIKSNFLYTAEKNEGKRRLEDWDAETMRLQQETEADQKMRRAALGRRLDDAGTANAEDMAGRGLLRSGLTFQNQDRIEEEGVEQENVIAQLLTNLIGQRGHGRLNQEAQNRSALNDRISQLTDQFNQKQTALV